MVSNVLKFDDVVAVENPSPAQRQEFEKLNAIREDIRSDRSVKEALAAFIDTEHRFKAEHTETITPDQKRELPESARKALDQVLGALAHSLKKHGIDNAPATLTDYVNGKPSQQIVRAAELSIISTAIQVEEATQPSQALGTPVVKQSVAAKNLGA